MKKINLKHLLIYAGIIFFIASCKKGKEDPSFTLLSRKARVSGNWKLKSGTLNIGIKDSTGATNALAYSFTGDSYHLDDLGKGVHIDGTSRLEISFTKKGKFVLNQSMDLLSVTASGEWDFLEKDRSYKKKERMSIKLDQISQGQWLNLFNMSLINFTYSIKELKNKEMILVADQEPVIETDSGVSEYVTAEYTFVQ